MNPLFSNVKWSRYIPHAPTPRQLAFLMLPHVEALYGGAAGGGKSDALLMIALQYFDVPGYKGLVLRRSFTDLKLPSSILNRAKEWLQPYVKSGEIRFTSHEHTFYSKEGGMLTFGYLDKEDDKFRYQGAEFHCVCIDEATQCRKEDLEYLLSRMRRTNKSPVPLRYRLATNPGGRSHAAIKKWFKIVKNDQGMFVGADPDRPFVHARVKDNPHLNAREYERQLDKLDPLTRERLKNGDWSASEEAVYKDHWFSRRYSLRHDYYQIGEQVVHKSQLFVFATTDVAGSERSAPEGRVLVSSTSKNDQGPSWSVEMIWGMTPDFQLVLLDVFRDQCHIPRFIYAAEQMQRKWQPAFVRAESNSINLGFIQGLQARGILVQAVPSVHDKLVRATQAIILAEKGRLWLPNVADWLPDLEDELFVWQGLRGEPSDQIDCISLAGQYVSQAGFGNDIDGSLSMGVHQAKPSFTSGLFPTATHTRGLFDRGSIKGRAVKTSA